MGYSGHKHQKGCKNIVISDKNGNPLALGGVHQVKKHDSILFDESIENLQKSFANATIIPPKGAFFNLDPAFDTAKIKKNISKNNLTPNIKANPRKSKTIKAEAPNKEQYKNRFVIERVFAWQDKFRRVVIRYETKATHFFAFLVIALTLINMRYLI